LPQKLKGAKVHKGGKGTTSTTTLTKPFTTVAFKKYSSNSIDYPILLNDS
jgi:hypothetical protein